MMETDEKFSQRLKGLSETLASMQIYTAVLRSDGPLTIREILQRTPVSAGSIYPIIQKRVEVGVLTDSHRDGVSQYDLTPMGFDYVQAQLTTLEVSASEILRQSKRHRHLKIASSSNQSDTSGLDTESPKPLHDLPPVKYADQ